MACQWTDEQTGGHCPTLAKHMTGTDKKWFTFTNGVHTDSLDPETYNRLYDFFELYVDQQAPITKSALVQASWPVAMQAIFGIDGPVAPHLRRCRPTRFSCSRPMTAPRPRSTRSPRSGCCSTTAPGNSNPGWPTRASRSRSRACRSREPRPAPGMSPPAARSRTAFRPNPLRRFHLGRPCSAADRLLRRHRLW